MQVSLIAAVAENGVIGRNNDLPWRIRDDMRFFVRMTRGHTIIAGRKNFEAMGALPNRHNIVITRDTRYNATADNVTIVHGLDRAFAEAKRRCAEEVFVAGGAEIYALALPVANVFYRTRVLAEVSGDVRFPGFDESEWSIEVLERHGAGPDNEYACVMEKLTRRR